jgi:hypothetical protein
LFDWFDWFNWFAVSNIWDADFHRLTQIAIGILTTKTRKFKRAAQALAPREHEKQISFFIKKS